MELKKKIEKVINLKILNRNLEKIEKNYFNFFQAVFKLDERGSPISAPFSVSLDPVSSNAQKFSQ